MSKLTGDDLNKKFRENVYTFSSLEMISSRPTHFKKSKYPQVKQ